ncbi:MAG: glycosyltransferase [Gemmataceae bacterium]|nr:glycosyltransferase [Gemmataceae bacterium]
MLSIVIPSYHRSDLLARCLTTVTAHAPPGTEVIVVDDASPGACAARTAAAFAGVRVVRQARRGGFAAAANAGIRAASGWVVELLNDDTEVQPGWADAALRWFAEPTIAAVAPLVLAWPEGTIIDSAGDDYDFGGFARKRGHGQRLAAEFLQPCFVFGASAAAAFYRRAALQQVGLFPVSFGAYFEDVDLACRLQRAGWQTRYEPASRVLHHVAASHGRPRRRLLEQQSRNEERLFWRNLAGDEYRRALPRHAAVLLGKAWRRWQEGTLTPWLIGRLRAFRDGLAALVGRGGLDGRVGG